jgi:hypothetical protein
MMVTGGEAQLKNGRWSVHGAERRRRKRTEEEDGGRGRRKRTEEEDYDDA